MNAYQARLAERRENVIAETWHLLAAGEWPPNIATRLGYKDVDSLRNAFRAWKQDDLYVRLRKDRWDNLSVEPTNQHLARRHG